MHQIVHRRPHSELEWNMSRILMVTFGQIPSNLKLQHIGKLHQRISYFSNPENPYSLHPENHENGLWYSFTRKLA